MQMLCTILHTVFGTQLKKLRLSFALMPGLWFYKELRLKPQPTLQNDTPICVHTEGSQEWLLCYT